MKNAAWCVIAACVSGSLLGVGGCGPKGDPAITGAGLSEEEAKARLGVVIDLKQFALTIEIFAENDSKGRLPTADGSGFDRRAVGLSWRAQLVRNQNLNPSEPEGVSKKAMEDLRAAFHDMLADKPPPKTAEGKAREVWDDPRLKDFSLRPLGCPVPGKTKEPWHTYSRVFIGNGAAFEPGKQLKWGDFTDGRDKTILIVEAGEAVPWPKPEELAYDPDKPLPKLGGLFPDGFYAAFADGKVRFIKNGTDEKLIRAMITRNGGEPIAELPPEVNTQALRKAAGIKD